MAESISAGSSTASAYTCTGRRQPESEPFEPYFDSYDDSELSAGPPNSLYIWLRSEPGMTQRRSTASRPPPAHEQPQLASSDSNRIAHRSMLGQLRACSSLFGRVELRGGAGMRRRRAGD